MRPTKECSRLNVLVVDDDPNDAFFLKRAFRVAGLDAELQVATDGNEAVESLRDIERLCTESGSAQSLHLVILDLKMPGLNGFEVLEWIRKQENFERLPVVILSSSDFVEDIEKAYALGATLYEVKPNEAQKMIGLVRRLGELSHQAVSQRTAAA